MYVCKVWAENHITFHAAVIWRQAGRPGHYPPAIDGDGVERADGKTLPMSKGNTNTSTVENGHVSPMVNDQMRKIEAG